MLEVYPYSHYKMKKQASRQSHMFNRCMSHEVSVAKQLNRADWAAASAWDGLAADQLLLK